VTDDARTSPEELVNVAFVCPFYRLFKGAEPTSLAQPFSQSPGIILENLARKPDGCGLDFRAFNELLI
jgi:hypothetical protein